MTGNIEEVDFTVKELKVFKGDREVDEAEYYNEKIQAYKALFKNLPFDQITKRFPFLTGLPLTPYPRMAKCLGLEPYNGKIEILDRYLRFGFDIKVKPADDECFFSIFEDQEEKYKRLEREVKGQTRKE